jgi:hypothetical protein
MIYLLADDLQVHDFCGNLNSESYQPGPFGSTTPADRAQQIADTIATESVRIKKDSRRQFLKAFDAWELSKKNQNDAVSQLRTLEQDVKEHTAVESVLEAFLTASYRQQSPECHHFALSCPLSHLESVHHNSCHARGDHSPMGSQKPRWNGCHHLQPVSSAIIHNVQ